MNFFNNKAALLDMAEREFIDMLKLGYTMLSLATTPITGIEQEKGVDDLKTMDKSINKKHRDVRKKLFEHLSLSGGKDLFPSLVLLSVIDDSERIGDYVQNIADILILSKNNNFGTLNSEINDLVNKTIATFQQTRDAYTNQNDALAESIVQEYKNTARLCDGMLKELFNGGDKVEKQLIAVALLLRYLKRINAHLKNIASAVVNPYHRIGYKVKK